MLLVDLQKIGAPGEYATSWLSSPSFSRIEETVDGSASNDRNAYMTLELVDQNISVETTKLDAGQFYIIPKNGLYKMELHGGMSTGLTGYYKGLNGSKISGYINLSGGSTLKTTVATGYSGISFSSPIGSYQHDLMGAGGDGLVLDLNGTRVGAVSGAPGLSCSFSYSWGWCPKCNMFTKSVGAPNIKEYMARGDKPSNVGADLNAHFLDGSVTIQQQACSDGHYRDWIRINSGNGTKTYFIGAAGRSSENRYSWRVC